MLQEQLTPNPLLCKEGEIHIWTSGKPASITF